MAETYGLRLGPLRFVTAISDVAETLGDQLEQVGASVIPGDRRPRPFNLEIPVRAASSEADPYAKGMQLRRQVRQLMENTAWRMQGLPFSWDIDPDLDCWLLIGGGDLTEIDDGLTFGEFKLSLTDCYIAGRPGTHLEGRRLDLGDRRSGLVPRDSWGRSYFTDFSGIGQSTYQLALPYGATYGYGTPQGGKWAQNISPGGILSFDRDPEISDSRGDCRVWSTSDGFPGVTTDPGDLDPDLHYGWERVLGQRIEVSSSLIVDNGLCRIAFLGDSAAEGFAIQGVGVGTGYNGPQMRVTGSFPITGTSWHADCWTVIELTLERVIVELSGFGGESGRDPADNRTAVRLILQRGWPGPRMEQRQIGSDSLSWSVRTPGATAAASGTASVSEVKVGGTRHALVAIGSSNITTTNVAGGLDLALPPASKGKLLIAQFGLDTEARSGFSPARFAALALDDARPVPVLVER